MKDFMVDVCKPLEFVVSCVIKHARCLLMKHIHVVTLGGYNRGNNSLLLMGSGTNMTIHYRSETGY